MKLITVLMIAAFPMVTSAQTKTKIIKKGKDKEKIVQASGTTTIDRDKDGTTTVKMESMDGHEAKVVLMPPKWALAHGYMNDRHVFFPDYNMFYTPVRGYVYWDGSGWATSAALPAYMKGVEMKKARVEILDDKDGNGFPERNYSALKEQFPAEPVAVDVPVPW